MPAGATHLHPLDLLLIVLYLLGITLFGLRFREKKSAASSPKSLETYFLAGNTIPWWAIALSIVSAETSTLTIISVPGVAFTGDFGFLQIVLGYMLGRVVVAMLFLPRYFEGRMLTAYQLIDRRFGSTLHKVTAGLFLLTRAAAEGVRVFAVSIVVSIAIGTGDILSIAIITLLTLLYTFEGGMAAVIWTDVVQMAIYVGGTAVALLTLGRHVPGGWSAIHTIAGAAGKFHMLHFALNLTETYTFWAGILGGAFLTMASHGTDQLMVQRMLAARNLREARLALLSSGVVIFIQFTFFLLIGAGLYVFYSLRPTPFAGGPAGLIPPDRLFPSFIVHEMPTGIAGLLVAAILAAAMSNLSAALNSLSSTTVVDFYLPWRRRRAASPGITSETDLDGRERTRVAKLSTVAWAVVLFAVAAYSVKVGGKGHVVETGLSIASVAYGALLGVFLLGTLTRFATQTGAILGMTAGFTFNLALWLLPSKPDHGWTVTTPTATRYIAIPHVAFTWYVFLGSLVTFAVGALASLLFRKQSLTRKRPIATTASAVVLAFAFLSVIPEGNLLFPQPAQNRALAFLSVIPKGNLLSAQPPQNPALAVLSVIPEGNLLSAQPAENPALAFLSVIPEGNLLSAQPAENPALAFLSVIPRGNLLSAQAPQNRAVASRSVIPEGNLLSEARKPNSYSPSFALLKGTASAVPIAAPNNAALAAEVRSPSLTLQSQSAPSTPYDFTPIQTLLNQAIANKKLPGAVVLIGHNGDIVFRQAFGSRKLAGEPGIHGELAAEPMTEDTVFDMASLTKCLATAVAIMQLYEQGKLDLDATVAQYLPEFGANGKQSVTIRELLTHYSGLPEDVSLKDPWGLAAPDKAEGIRRAMQSTLYGPPGLTFKYSDINFITLGALVEKLSGKRLDLYAEEQIFAPLGLTRTRYLAMDKACGVSGFAPLSDRPDKHGKIAAETLVDPCTSKMWERQRWLPNTAPTAHDDESKADPTQNPNFDHLLRGTVHDPTTRRMGGVAGHAGVFSTAGDIALFAQALLDKLTENTGPFPLQQSTLQRMTTPQQPPTAQGGATIFTPTGEPTKGIALRGFGWDINSAFSRPRGAVFPTVMPGETPSTKLPSFGHTGFTGTSLWIDPNSDTYVILLSNAIHPRGGTGAMSALRGQVATAAAQALHLTNTRNAANQCLCTACLGCPNLSVNAAAAELAVPPSPPDAPSPPSALTAAQGGVANAATPQTLTGIDVLEQTHYGPLHEAAARHGAHLNLGLLTNQTGLDAHGRRTIDLLAAEAPRADPAIHLLTLFSPEHGISGKLDSTTIAPGSDPATYLPIVSLYGARDAQRRPSHAQLAPLDAVVIDLQDAGVRFWTYETVTAYFLEAAARELRDFHHDLEIIVLDRPNPLGGLAVQGPVSDPGHTSYIDYMPLPVRHGLTLAELALYFNGEATPTAPTGLLNPESPTIPSEANANSAPASPQRKGLHAHLTVIPMQNWSRAEFFDDTHLPWTNPSPNLRSLTANLFYPGIGLFDTTSLSVGRGSATPFEHLGAGATPTQPAWFQSRPVADCLTARRIPGVAVTPSTFPVAEDPNRYPFHGQTIPAIAFQLETPDGRATLDSPEFGIEIMACLHRLYPTEFALGKASPLLANATTLAALQAGQDPRVIAADWQPALQAFRQRRAQYLLYPDNGPQAVQRNSPAINTFPSK